MKRLLQRWFAPKPQLTAAQSARLAAWQALPEPDEAADRWVVLDVETTGLNLMTDTLISIGAITVAQGRIALGESFSVVLQQERTSRRENILVHGITGSAQREGTPPVDALLAFLEFAGKDPLVAFHVTFDETMIRRAMRQYLGLAYKRSWLDLAYLMPALNPRLLHTHRVLDDWIGRFGIRIELRHNALADALATAQLLQVARAQAAIRKVSGFRQFRALESEQRRLRGVS